MSLRRHLQYNRYTVQRKTCVCVCVWKMREGCKCVWVCEKIALLKNHYTIRCTGITCLTITYYPKSCSWQQKRSCIYACLIKQPSFLDSNCTIWQVGSLRCEGHNYFSLSFVTNASRQSHPPTPPPPPSLSKATIYLSTAELSKWARSCVTEKSIKSVSD